MRTDIIFTTLVAASALAAAACRAPGEDDELTYQQIDESDETLGDEPDEPDDPCTTDEAEAEPLDLDEYPRHATGPATRDDCASPPGGLLALVSVTVRKFEHVGALWSAAVVSSAAQTAIASR